MKIVQISDTHVSHRGGVPNRNLERVVDFVNQELRPDLVVNSGDIGILDPDAAEDRQVALRAHERFDAPVRFVPGNHDVGQSGHNPWMGISVTSDRVQRFRSDLGRDHWVEMVGGWAVVGLDSEVMGSGLSEEAEQWNWLADTAKGLAGTATIVFLHRPLSPLVGSSASPDHALSLDEGDRDRLLAALQPVDLRAVGSGHLHRYTCDIEGDFAAVSAPSTAFIVNQKGLGSGLVQLGVVEYSTDGDALDIKYRTTSLLEEGEPWGLPEFSLTLEEMQGATARQLARA